MFVYVSFPFQGEDEGHELAHRVVAEEPGDILWQLVLEILMAPFNHVVEKNAVWLEIMFSLPVLVWWLTTIAARIAACF